MPQKTGTATTTPTRRETSSRDPYRLACEVADVLAAMTREERIRAYRSRVFAPRELAIAAAWLPEEMPVLNGELEWLVVDSAECD